MFQTRGSPGRMLGGAFVSCRCSGFRSICCDRSCCAAFHNAQSCASECRVWFRNPMAGVGRLPHPLSSTTPKIDVRSGQRIALHRPPIKPSAGEPLLCIESLPHRCYDFRNLGARGANGYSAGESFAASASSKKSRKTEEKINTHNRGEKGASAL